MGLELCAGTHVQFFRFPESSWSQRFSANPPKKNPLVNEPPNYAKQQRTNNNADRNATARRETSNCIGHLQAARQIPISGPDSRQQYCWQSVTVHHHAI